MPGLYPLPAPMDVTVWFGRLVSFTKLSEKYAASIFKVSGSTKEKGVTSKGTIISCFFPLKCVSTCYFDKFWRIINFKPTSQKAHFVSITNIDVTMTLMEIMCFLKESHETHTANALCGHDAEFLKCQISDKTL
jgi:hypothetical protein